MLTTPILYSYRRCPYAMRARLALQHINRDYYLREIDLKNKPPQMLAVSPKGTVPVLCLNQQTIDESLDIVSWAFSQKPESHISKEQQEEQRKAIAGISKFVKPIYAFKYPERYSQVEHEESKIALSQYCQQLDHHLSKHAAGWYYSEFSQAEICLLPFIRQYIRAGATEFAKSGYHALAEWYQQRIESERFKAIMAKYPRWDGNNTILIKHNA